MKSRNARFTQVMLIEDMSFGGGPFPSGPLPVALDQAIDGKGHVSFSGSSHGVGEARRRTGRATAQPFSA